ncbi:hypothetical protein VPHK225_0042 [Vibrio phage K225]
MEKMHIRRYKGLWGVFFRKTAHYPRFQTNKLSQCIAFAAKHHARKGRGNI